MTLSHHSLVAWQRADDLFIRLHQLSLKRFPAFERFELGGQLRRAAFSVACNIVEGFARRHVKERVNFFYSVHTRTSDPLRSLVSRTRPGPRRSRSSSVRRTRSESMSMPLSSRNEK